MSNMKRNIAHKASVPCQSRLFLIVELPTRLKGCAHDHGTCSESEYATDCEHDNIGHDLVKRHFHYVLSRQKREPHPKARFPKLNLVVVFLDYLKRTVLGTLARVRNLELISCLGHVCHDAITEVHETAHGTGFGQLANLALYHQRYLCFHFCTFLIGNLRGRTTIANPSENASVNLNSFRQRMELASSVLLYLVTRVM